MANGNVVTNALEVGTKVVVDASPKFLPVLNIFSVAAGLAVNVIMLVVGINELKSIDKPEDTPKSEE